MKTDPVEIFQSIRSVIQPYSTMGFTSRTDSTAKYDLWSEKEIELEGKKEDGAYFVGLEIQKDHVGFYYMPVYAEPEMKSIFGPDFLKLLKGKSCFHIKELDDKMLKQIMVALAEGFKSYKAKGWV